jgi:FkbM family methyltransferase
MLSELCCAYYRGPEHPMKQRVWSWLRRASGYARLTVRYGRGGYITLDERDLLQREILVAGTYEPEVWEALSAFARAAEVVWDVGAHIGSFAIRALLDTRVGEVHAFEPDPIQAEVLSQNLALNGRQYVVHRYALGCRHERRQLQRGPLANMGLSSLVLRGGSETCEVECRSADEVVFSDGVPAPTLLKVDVEGWEGEVLRGAERLLREQPPRAIVLEAACDASGEVLDPGIVEYLRSHGYEWRRIIRPSGIIDVRENYLAWELT